MVNFEEYKKLLEKFVAYPSISTNPKFQPDILNTVEWLSNLFKSSGFKVEIWKGKNSNPVVFSEFYIGKDKPTLLIYGHYDVQPAAKTDGWKSEPFKLTVTKGKLIGRGATDNKGQILIHIVTAINLIKMNKLAFNLKFLIEGNEETGNDDLPTLMLKNKKKLNCDVLMVSDGELTNGKPTIEVSLRGGFNSTLVYKTGKNNLHSGIFGGAVPNAAIELTRFLSKLFNADNTVNYKEFYLGADKVTASEFKNNEKLSREAKDLAKLAGVKQLVMKKGENFYSETGLNPTIQITGIKTGYIDQGYANIVPAEAEVRLNFRIVASQKADKVFKEFEKFVKTNTPKYIDYTLAFKGLHNPIKINTENPHIGSAEKILKLVYKTTVNRKNVGGAIPFVGDVKEILGVDTLLVPMANEDCNMHGANENLEVSLAKKALEFSYKFMSQSVISHSTASKWLPSRTKRRGMRGKK